MLALELALEQLLEPEQELALERGLQIPSNIYKQQ
jgi:hypothetical protein